MNRIDRKFRELKKAKKKAFIVFITAGYPDLKTTEKLILEFSRIGVDIVEIGVPFSDPMADGPIIQEASQAALKKRVNTRDILKMVRRLRRRTQIPLCLMTYYNPIFCFGEENFVRQAGAAGVDGLIVPDLPPEEGMSLLSLARKAKLHSVLFLSPTSPAKRVRMIARLASGFIYYVSLTGVTGPRQSLAADLARNIRRIKKSTKCPVCAGFGISSPLQVRRVNRIADGVIIGSAIVRKVKENIGRPRMAEKVAAFALSLKQ